MQQPELQGGQSGALLGWTLKRIAAEERVSRHSVQKRPSTEQRTEHQACTSARWGANPEIASPSGGGPGIMQGERRSQGSVLALGWPRSFVTLSIEHGASSSSLAPSRISCA